MKKILITFIALVPTFSVNAAVNCPGEITNLLDNPPRCNVTDANGLLGHHVAYRHTGINSGRTWICSESDLSDALVMINYANGIPLTVRVETTCETTEQYQYPIYIVPQAH